MKKALTILSFSAVMAFVNMAMATTWTATDNPNFKFGSGKTYTNTLVLNGFTPGDTITSAQLLLDFDNTGIVTKVVFDATKDPSWHLVIGGFRGDLFYKVPVSTLADGKLDLSLTGGSLWGLGGLTLDSVILTAEGSAPVPEPGTLILLGAGLIVFTIYLKRRQNV
jgi:hypothetical protein